MRAQRVKELQVVRDGTTALAARHAQTPRTLSSPAERGVCLRVGSRHQGDDFDAALVARLESALSVVAPSLVAVLLPAILSAVRDVDPAPCSERTSALLTVTEAAGRLGVGRTTVFGLIRSGELRSVSIGRRRLVPADAINEFVDALGSPAHGAPSPTETTVS